VIFRRRFSKKIQKSFALSFPLIHFSTSTDVCNVVFFSFFFSPLLFLFFRCTHNIAYSMHFCCCVVYALKCMDGFFSDANTNTLHRQSHTLWQSDWLVGSIVSARKRVQINYTMMQKKFISLSLPPASCFFRRTQEMARNNLFRSNANN
jgi:glucan phosphoethanolaminetransferase (alkaline phosphatase superfamily)